MPDDALVGHGVGEEGAVAPVRAEVAVGLCVGVGVGEMVVAFLFMYGSMEPKAYRAVVGLVAPAAALLGAEREEAPAHVLEAGIVLVRVNLAGRTPMVQIGLMK